MTCWNAAGVGRQGAALAELGEAGAAEAAALDARWRAAQGDKAGAVALLEEAAKKYPESLGVRVALSHIRLGDGSPSEVIESALRSVLELDPANAQAKHNLEVLLRNTGTWVEGVIDSSNLPDGRTGNRHAIQALPRSW